MKMNDVPTYGLLAINHAYNEGKLTFKEWLELSRAWALKIKEQYGERATSHPPHTVTARPSQPVLE